MPAPVPREHGRFVEAGRHDRRPTAAVPVVQHVRQGEAGPTRSLGSQVVDDQQPRAERLVDDRRLMPEPRVRASVREVDGRHE